MKRSGSIGLPFLAMPLFVAWAHAQQPGTAKPVLTPAPRVQPAPSPVASTTPALQQPAGSNTSSASNNLPVPPTPAPEASSPNYVIGPEDSLSINVWKEAGVSGSVLVRPDGKISLPLVADIEAAGLTPMNLSKVIATRLKNFINDPTVTVTVVGVNSKRVYMIGEIGRVGPLPITPGMSILQAIATAGGVSQYANSRHIYILRGEPGKQQKIKFDYKRALKSGDMQGVTLVPGDTIVVP